MDGEFVSVSDAARRMNISRMLLSRRIRSGDLPCFEDRLDGRRRLIRISDLEALRHPRPVQLKEAAAAA